MRFTECRSRSVLGTDSAVTLGTVSGFVVDPTTRSVAAVRVKRKGDDTLPWSALTAFGPDAVTVAGEASFTAAEGRLADLLGKQHELLGKRVLTDAGDEAGSVQDVDFDPATGALTALLTTDGEVAGDRLLGVGSWAVVVRAAT